MLWNFYVRRGERENHKDFIWDENYKAMIKFSLLNQHYFAGKIILNGSCLGHLRALSYSFKL